MNYATIKDCDIANGPGVRVSLFVSGCTRGCPGCFNKPAQDFHYGSPFTSEVEDRVVGMVSRSYIKGLSLLGGDPLEPCNRDALLPLLRRLRSELPDKDVWCWTGYSLEDLTRPNDQEFLALIDVLVDGPFVQELKDVSLLWKGSSNQRVISMCSRG